MDVKNGFIIYRGKKVKIDEAFTEKAIHILGKSAKQAQFLEGLWKINYSFYDSPNAFPISNGGVKASRFLIDI